MKPLRFLVLLAAVTPVVVSSVAQPLPRDHVDDFTGHPRAIIISDIGNEPDDQMSLVRLLLYSNELDIEALIAATSTWQKTATHPETMHQLIDAYGQVRPNLLLHAKGWPDGRRSRRRASTPGKPPTAWPPPAPANPPPAPTPSFAAADSDDPRPLWICIWGGANTLAQALIEARATRTPAELAKLVAKLRVYSISDQDDAGPWIRREFPDLFYIVSPPRPPAANTLTPPGPASAATATTATATAPTSPPSPTNGSTTNIRSKGPLGKVYPRFMFIMEGDTPSFLGLIDNGLNAWRRPDWGGWGGRYVYRQPYGETPSHLDPGRR